MNCRRIRQAGAAALAAVALLGSVSCGDTVRQGHSSGYLVIDQLLGATGREPDKMSNTLGSDVLTYVKKTIGTEIVYVPTVFEDPGKVIMRVQMKDPGTPTSPTSVAEVNAITINRYHVQFVRADGRNTPGVDVPYGFDGAVTGTIGAAPTTLTFLLVRFQLKEEAPLKALIGNGGAIGISTIAQVTFYGHDQAGNEVSVTGQISVNFADWGDPD